MSSFIEFVAMTGDSWISRHADSEEPIRVLVVSPLDFSNGRRNYSAAIVSRMDLIQSPHEDYFQHAGSLFGSTKVMIT